MSAGYYGLWLLFAHRETNFTVLAPWLPRSGLTSPDNANVELRQTELDHKLPEGAQGWRSAAAQAASKAHPRSGFHEPDGS